MNVLNVWLIIYMRVKGISVPTNSAVLVLWS